MFMAQLSYSFEGPNDTHHEGRYIFELDRKKRRPDIHFGPQRPWVRALSYLQTGIFEPGKRLGSNFRSLRKYLTWLAFVTRVHPVFTRKGWLQIRCDVINHSPLIFVQCEEIRARSNEEWLELGNLIPLKFRAPENRADMPPHRKMYKVHTQNLDW